MLAAVNILLRGLPSLSGAGDWYEKLPHGSIEDYDDINTKDQYRTALEAGCTEKEALEACLPLQPGQCEDTDAVEP